MNPAKSRRRRAPKALPLTPHHKTPIIVLPGDIIGQARVMAGSTNDPEEPEPIEPTDSLNSKQRATLQAIFGMPVRSDIPWRNIEVLLVALGAEVSQGRGSRVRVALRGRKAVFHEPHPERVTDKGAVVTVREFLREVDIIP